MTIQERLDKLKDRYINYYIKHISNNIEDAKYSWWEMGQQMQEWSSKEHTYVPMSLTKTYQTLLKRVKELNKELIN
jgi:hypothetical protein